jgi:hypothetical protein
VSDPDVLSDEVAVKFFAPIVIENRPPIKPYKGKIPDESIQSIESRAAREGLDIERRSNLNLIHINLECFQTGDFSGLTTKRRNQLRHVGLLEGNGSLWHRFKATAHACALLKEVEEEARR